ncbi:hypothetical protein TTHERM_00770600 (macronuclear) [Tetrahymena thermophila SB210]|uniref:Uncharacterized protein n=1 Tax=Tetrahymena thermophila (strain SB210) TaxID=312017 RepID=Q23AT5_TETTS|nr:hypothetical protein TTHERM_00770600 [Tetrahymena thermophila SB210]EAR93607.3 hypothetical protein TTHERM_00770600 [Tetrahymena thermophila SB210]|eukprot:XP_001013852.3 hypothetical protein TTHERM_00770600 [Tetrahymena thermophila SB210]
MNQISQNKQYQSQINYNFKQGVQNNRFQTDFNQNAYQANQFNFQQQNQNMMDYNQNVQYQQPDQQMYQQNQQYYSQQNQNQQLGNNGMENYQMQPNDMQVNSMNMQYQNQYDYNQMQQYQQNGEFYNQQNPNNLNNPNGQMIDNNQNQQYNQQAYYNQNMQQFDQQQMQYINQVQQQKKGIIDMTNYQIPSFQKAQQIDPDLTQEQYNLYTQIIQKEEALNSTFQKLVSKDLIFCMDKIHIYPFLTRICKKLAQEQKNDTSVLECGRRICINCLVVYLIKKTSYNYVQKLITKQNQQDKTYLQYLDDFKYFKIKCPSQDCQEEQGNCYLQRKQVEDMINCRQGFINK